MSEEEILNELNYLDHKTILLEKQMLKNTLYYLINNINANHFIIPLSSQYKWAIIPLIIEEIKIICHETAKLEPYNLNNNTCYQQIMQKYNTVNKRIIQILDILNTNNPASLAGAYTYLLKNGYLSNHHTFKIEPTSQDLVLNLRNPSIEIINGTGVCRHISFHFNTLLKEYNLPSTLVPLSITSSLILFSQSLKTGTSDLERARIYSRQKISLQQEYNYLLGNHLINGIQYNSKAYWLDLTNNICFHKKDNHHLQSYHTNKLTEEDKKYLENFIAPIKLFFCPLEELHVKELLQKESATYEEIYQEYQRGQFIMKNNLSLLEKMYDANQEDYQIINHDCNRLEKSIYTFYSLKKIKVPIK